MIKLDSFDMYDSFMTPKKVMLRYALDAAKQHCEMMWYQARAVSIREVDYEDPKNVKWTFEVWGHEIEVPDEFKHWTERLINNAHMLTTGDAWDGL